MGAPPALVEPGWCGQLCGPVRGCDGLAPGAGAGVVVVVLPVVVSPLVVAGPVDDVAAVARAAPPPASAAMAASVTITGASRFFKRLPPCC